MSIGRLLAEADELTPASIAFAREISHASSGETLGRIVRETMESNCGAYSVVRSAVDQRISDLGGAGAAAGLFMLASDLATTEAVVRDRLEGSQRSELRRLWNDLRSRR